MNSLPLCIIKTDAHVKCTDTDIEIEIGGVLSCQRMLAFLLISQEKTGPYKPCSGRTGQCMNHAPAILAAPALIYNTHWVFVVWIIIAHFHHCSLLGTLSGYTMLQV